MEQEDNDEKLTNILKEVFTNVNNWVVFAETKIGALIGISMVLLIKSIELLTGIEDYNYTIDSLLFLNITFHIIGILVALYSFFPNTKNFKENNNCIEFDTADRILIFFEDISIYCNSKNYLRDLTNYYLEIKDTPSNFKKIHVDYAKEILINSKIASGKYKKFKYSLVINCFSILLLLAYLLIQGFNKNS